MLKLITLFTSFLFTCSLFAQDEELIPNFTITDTEDVEHNLYEDYLDNGYTVVIKFFFVGCPPCSAIAPDVQEAFEKWGEGDYDVQFLELSTRDGDTNDEVEGYLGGLDVTIPAAGADGGSTEALKPFLEGEFGSYFGTPAFAVVDSTGNVIFFKSTSKVEEVEEAIIETGAEGPPALPSEFNFNISASNGTIVTDLDIELRDSQNAEISYPINLEDGVLSITSLEEEYPGIDHPILHLSKNDDYTEGVTSLDLITVQKHILRIEEIGDPYKIMAADVNGDRSITAIDLITIQKLILGLNDSFPNGIESYQFVPNDFSIEVLPGNSLDFDIIAIKMGDVNGN